MIRGARANNLKNIDVSIPLGTLTAVTGVSGSGKSTLVNDILYRALAKSIYKALAEPGAHDRIDGIELIDKVIEIDQSPIGRTPRSNPATYTGMFTFIRELFAMMPDAKTRGFKPGRFSFNVKGGRCEACQGDGVIAIEMHFLPDVYVTCEQCKGRRYNRETLDIQYRGKSIAEVLDLTVDQALPLLENFPPIANKLRTLQDVGLGYIELGQSATTLSGGEAQRVKLARELSRRSTGRTLYILDEPTTGLHFEDTRKLLDVLNKLVDQGNTVVVIEHNLDVIRSADYLIDLGPEGGAGGGRLIASGSPQDVAANPRRQRASSFGRCSGCRPPRAPPELSATQASPQASRMLRHDARSNVFSPADAADLELHPQRQFLSELASQVSQDRCGKLATVELSCEQVSAGASALCAPVDLSGVHSSDKGKPGSMLRGV